MKVPQKLKKPYTAEEREHLKDIAKTERDVASWSYFTVLLGVLER